MVVPQLSIVTLVVAMFCAAPVFAQEIQFSSVDQTALAGIWQGQRVSYGYLYLTNASYEAGCVKDVASLLYNNGYQVYEGGLLVYNASLEIGDMDQTSEQEFQLTLAVPTMAVSNSAGLDGELLAGIELGGHAGFSAKISSYSKSEGAVYSITQQESATHAPWEAETGCAEFGIAVDKESGTAFLKQVEVMTVHVDGDRVTVTSSCLGNTTLEDWCTNTKPVAGPPQGTGGDMGPKDLYQYCLDSGSESSSQEECAAVVMAPFSSTVSSAIDTGKLSQDSTLAECYKSYMATEKVASGDAAACIDALDTFWTDMLNELMKVINRYCASYADNCAVCAACATFTQQGCSSCTDSAIGAGDSGGSGNDWLSMLNDYLGGGASQNPNDSSGSTDDGSSGDGSSGSPLDWGSSSSGDDSSDSSGDGISSPGDDSSGDNSGSDGPTPIGPSSGDDSSGGDSGSDEPTPIGPSHPTYPTDPSVVSNILNTQHQGNMDIINNIGGGSSPQPSYSSGGYYAPVSLVSDMLASSHDMSMSIINNIGRRRKLLQSAIPRRSLLQSTTDSESSESSYTVTVVVVSVYECTDGPCLDLAA